MLQRRNGLHLLTLLVVTGLAGTANDNALSGKERKFALSIMKKSKENASSVFKGLSPEELHNKKSSSQWTVKDYIHYTADQEKKLWEIFETTMDMPTNPEKRSDIKLSDNQIIELAMKNPLLLHSPQIQPVENSTFEHTKEAISYLKARRNMQVKYIRNSTEDLRNHVVLMPFGWIDGYQLQLFIATLNNELFKKINEIALE